MNSSLTNPATSERLQLTPPEDADHLIEDLCALATQHAALIRGVAPELRACGGFDPALGCCVVYFRLDQEAEADAHRDVAVREFERWGFRPLASGSAPVCEGEQPGYCLLVDAGAEDVPDLRAAILKAIIAWDGLQGSTAVGSAQ